MDANHVDGWERGKSCMLFMLIGRESSLGKDGIYAGDFLLRKRTSMYCLLDLHGREKKNHKVQEICSTKDEE